MRNFLYILILANILYFVWLKSDNSTPSIGEVVVRESDLGPMLAATAINKVEPAASIGAMLGAGEQSDLSAVVGMTCVSVGSFRTRSDAEKVVAALDGDDVHTAIRMAVGEIFVGHWVQIRDIADEETSSRVLAILKNGGLTDAYPVSTEDEGLKISLGVFGELSRAERTAEAVRALGLKPEISVRSREGEVFFVDLGVPPGKDLSALIADYGEDSVLQHDLASCPRIEK